VLTASRTRPARLGLFGLDFSGLLPGLGVIGALTLIAMLAVQQFGLSKYGIGSLTLAIALGAVLGNALPTLGQGICQPGLRFSQSRLLRAGVALYGFNLSIQQIAAVGSTGIGIDIIMVCSTLILGWFIGTRVFGMDKETALLTSAGSAICGAAAVVATVPVLRMGEKKAAENTAAAVATVVLFGTISILLYPALYAWLGADRSQFGIYIGSTVHEVAQVVAIGNIVGGDAARAAVIVKMIRVILLVPFLLTASVLFRGKSAQGQARGKITIPWFAIVFIVFAGINSLHVIPEPVVTLLRQTGIVLLTAAMAALGIDTNIARLRQTGLRAFGLGVCLYVHLILVGGAVNYWLNG
jgi:uncharacterized integral membrane protein (TIGR00698 family)